MEQRLSLTAIDTDYYYYLLGFCLKTKLRERDLKKLDCFNFVIKIELSINMIFL